MLRPSEITATARACNAEAEIVAAVAHNMMIELRWQTVADRILVWLKEWQLKQRRPLEHRLGTSNRQMNHRTTAA
jgi:hypothetical protein